MLSAKNAEIQCRPKIGWSVTLAHAGSDTHCLCRNQLRCQNDVLLQQISHVSQSRSSTVYQFNGIVLTDASDVRGTISAPTSIHGLCITKFNILMKLDIGHRSNFTTCARRTLFLHLGGRASTSFLHDQICYANVLCLAPTRRCANCLSWYTHPSHRLD